MDKLLRDLANSVDDEGDADAEVCVSGRNGHPESPPGCSEAQGEGGHELKATAEFLRKAYPLLDRWMRWLLVTQRPGAEGWGGQTKRAPLGAFQVHILYVLLQFTAVCPTHFALKGTNTEYDTNASTEVRNLGDWLALFRA